MGCDGKIKNRNALDTEGAAVDGGIAADFHHDLVSVEFPLGTWQLAGGNSSVINEVVNLRLATQLENRPVFLLLQGANGDILRIDRGRRGGKRRRRDRWRRC